jgi:hypothetical protein
MKSGANPGRCISPLLARRDRRRKITELAGTSSSYSSLPQHHRKNRHAQVAEAEQGNQEACRPDVKGKKAAHQVKKHAGDAAPIWVTPS